MEPLTQPPAPPPSNFQSIIQVGNSGRLTKSLPADYDGDPRGFLWMWEPPRTHHTYIMGIDPTVGRTGWSRYSRSSDDKRTDNGAIEVIRLGRNGAPDMQVAEYAAPIDAFELGIVANTIGRIYSGTEDDQCKCIIEVYPGPGAMTMRQMIELGYGNMWMWEYYANAQPTQTPRIGWTASNSTNRDLWAKFSRHLIRDEVRLHSPWLYDELAGCRWDPIKQWASNSGGHDDRVRAFSLACWAGNGWSMASERTKEMITNTAQVVDWQRSDRTVEEMYASWDAAMDRMERDY